MISVIALDLWLLGQCSLESSQIAPVGSRPSLGHADLFLQEGFQAQDSEGSTKVLSVTYPPQVGYLHFDNLQVRYFQGREDRS